MNAKHKVGAAGAVMVVAFAVDPWAGGVLRALLLFDHWGEMRELLTAAKFLGSGLGTVVVGLAVAGLDRRRGWRTAGVIWLSFVLSGAAAIGLKVATGRERPEYAGPDVKPVRFGFRGPARGLETAYQSFPSGHTTSAFATATVLSSFYPPARAAFYLVAAGTAAHRVARHQHFASDVAAGAILGHWVALLVLVRARRRRAHAGPRSGDDAEPDPEIDSGGDAA